MIDKINKYEIPNYFLDMLKKQYLDEDIIRIIKGFRKKRYVTIRVNTLKSNINEVKEQLISEGIEIEDVLWSKKALIIKNANENIIQSMNIYKDGKIYMQSLSSMLPPIILNPKENTDILDMCAAPRRKNYSNCSNY